jgi:nitrite reductase/ring-hydroxylating ferredoxin subunit
MSRTSKKNAEPSDTGSAAQQDPTGQVSVFSRRNVLAVGAIGVAGVALAACSSGSNTSGGSQATAPGANGGGAGSGAVGALIVATAEVPVGGAKLAEAGGSTWLVAQPTEGDIVCHSGICTHEGCPLTQIDGDRAICRCHNSQFDIFTGAVLQSPALRALSPQSVTVTNGDVFLG